MSNDYQKPFFLEVPSHFFRCTDELHNVRDNLLIEVASNADSFMIRGPALLSKGFHIRFSNRSKAKSASLHLMISIEPRIIFDFDEAEINTAYLELLQDIENEDDYTANQICCTVALRELFEHQRLALRLDMKHRRLYAHMNRRHYDPSFVELEAFQMRWLAMQKPTQQTSSSVRRKQK
ncbi:MAG TPA: hypothetical protein PLR08_01320 [bacterium]|nr:MAG: hypothetical protein H6759_04675 [Candidatus Nomurabacteria bacterium]HPF95173.1 hypothetical protein [bacterium]